MSRRTVGKDGSRSAFTLIELLVVVAIIALLISILLPSLARARELSKRAVCAANMKGMGTGFYTYANENNEMWPICNSTASANPSAAVTYAGTTMGAYRNSESNETSNRLSTTRNMWILVRMQASTQKSFICPSSDDAPNEDDSPQSFYDFGGKNASIAGVPSGPQATDAYATCSYGVQVPYSLTVQKSKPSVDCDQRMALAADKGPYGAFLEAGKGSSPGAPSVTASSSPDNWKKWNSPNHGGPQNGDGQNALFADGHVDWNAKPTVGIGYDNLYTSWGTGSIDQGNEVTTSSPTPQSATDSVIYP